MFSRCHVCLWFVAEGVGAAQWVRFTEGRKISPNIISSQTIAEFLHIFCGLRITQFALTACQFYSINPGMIFSQFSTNETKFFELQPTLELQDYFCPSGLDSGLFMNGLLRPKSLSVKSSTSPTTKKLSASQNEGQ